MSLDVMARAWKHSRQSGSALLALLALSSSADDDGVIWLRGITVDFIGSKARTKKRQTQNILQGLEDAGEIYAPPTAGRGRTTRYFVTIGLDQKQIMTVLRREYGCSALEARAIADALIERQTEPIVRGKKMQPRASFLTGGASLGASGPAEKMQSATPIKKVQSATKKSAEKVQSATIKGAIPYAQNSASEASGWANPDPIRHDQEIHDPPPPPLPPTTQNGGGGGGDRSQEEPTETESYLLDEGFSDEAAHEFRDLDLAACRKDIRQAKAGGQQNGGIIRRWRRKPPRPSPPPTPPPNGQSPLSSIEPTLPRAESMRRLLAERKT